MVIVTLTALATDPTCFPLDNPIHLHQVAMLVAADLENPDIKLENKTVIDLLVQSRVGN